VYILRATTPFAAVLPLTHAAATHTATAAHAATGAAHTTTGAAHTPAGSTRATAARETHAALVALGFNRRLFRPGRVVQDLRGFFIGPLGRVFGIPELVVRRSECVAEQRRRCHREFENIASSQHHLSSSLLIVRMIVSVFQMG
jgi:hypothetical protein